MQECWPHAWGDGKVGARRAVEEAGPKDLADVGCPHEQTYTCLQVFIRHFGLAEKALYL